jgi:hypothetical protein
LKYPGLLLFSLWQDYRLDENNKIQKFKLTKEIVEMERDFTVKKELIECSEGKT